MKNFNPKYNDILKTEIQVHLEGLFALPRSFESEHGKD